MTHANLGAVLAHAAAVHHDRIAIQDESSTFTYEFVLNQAKSIAAELVRCDVVADSPVMVRVSNHPMDFCAFLGVWLAGGVVTPVHRTAPPAIVNAVQSKAQCCVSLDLTDSSSLHECVSELQITDSATSQRTRLLGGAALVIFTSGSTGLPKGVVLSHSAFLGKLSANQQLFNFSERDVTLLVLNNTFSFAIWMALLTLNHGATLRTCPRFEPAHFLDQLVDWHVSRVGVVPTMIRSLFATSSAQTMEQARIRLVRAGALQDVVIGGEPLGSDLSVRLREFIAPARLYDVYGLTETSTSDFILTPDAYLDHPDTIGQAAKGVLFRIMGDDGEECSPGKVGELQLRSRFEMAGYLGDEALTAEAYAGPWFKTGDLATSDDEGFVTVVGRRKELIVRGANKITPLEVERALCSCADIDQALVTGVPDPILGQKIHALLISKHNQSIDSDKLRSDLAKRIERFKFPDVCYVGTSLPTGRTGKVDRGQLQTLLLSGEITRLADWEH